MRKTRIALLIAFAAGLFWTVAAFAQSETLTLSLRRDFGYGLGQDIEGTFTMTASGPSDLTRVEFYIDDLKIGEATRAPFRLQFVTENYSLGVHSLYAIGYKSDGSQLRSQAVTANFVPASSGMKAVIPILAIIFGVILLAALIPIVTGRKTIQLAPGAPRKYPIGGAVCPKCERPFGVHFYGLNLFGSKLDRCPYCGRWSLVHLASLETLHAAEQAELEGSQAQIPETSEDEKLKKELDDSKYQGL